MLRRHLHHRDRDVGLTVITALVAMEAPEGDGDRSRARLRTRRDEAAGAVIRADPEHATHVLRAHVTLCDYPAAHVLCSALTDELELLRRRVLAGLSMRYDAEELIKVGFQLAQPNPRFHALALEWLDVTLVGTDRAAVTLLEPELSAHQRMRLLVRSFPIPPATPRTVLLDIVEDRDDRWRRPGSQPAPCSLLPTCQNWASKRWPGLSRRNHQSATTTTIRQAL